MNKLWSRLWVPALTLALLGTIAGCSSDDDGTTAPPTRVDLSGNYTMLSINQGGITLTPPAATGTLVLTATNYTLSLVTPDGQGGQTVINDTGTYVALTDGSWAQDSDGALGQSTGTYTESGNNITVNATSAGIQVITVWQRN